LAGALVANRRCRGAKAPPVQKKASC
jgi:hypothetical protein